MAAPNDTNRTLANQDNLPKLPIPPLESTCARYLKALEGLQDPKDHNLTKKVVEEFLNGDGPRIQARLNSWAQNKSRCAVCPLAVTWSHPTCF
jgi:carnitine O-acetyltransferase